MLISEYRTLLFESELSWKKFIEKHIEINGSAQPNLHFYFNSLTCKFLIELMSSKHIPNQSQSNTEHKRHNQMLEVKHDITLFLETLTFSLVEKDLNCISLTPERKSRKPSTSLSKYVYLSQVSCFSLTSEWNISPTRINICHYQISQADITSYAAIVLAYHGCQFSYFSLIKVKFPWRSN